MEKISAGARSGSKHPRFCLCLVTRKGKEKVRNKSAETGLRFVARRRSRAKRQILLGFLRFVYGSGWCWLGARKLYTCPAWLGTLGDALAARSRDDGSAPM